MLDPFSRLFGEVGAAAKVGSVDGVVPGEVPDGVLVPWEPSVRAWPFIEELLAPPGASLLRLHPANKTSPHDAATAARSGKPRKDLRLFI